MIEMARRFLRQKFGSPGLVVALALLAVVQTFGFAHGAGPAGFSIANWAIFVLAAGSVSRDVSSGALQMILSRPIRRTQYLFGRYAGILVAFALFLVFTSLLAFVVVNLAAPGEASQVSPARLATLTGETFMDAAFPAAILLFFSTFLPGIADLLGLLVLYVVLHLPVAAGTVFSRVTDVARENMVPTVSWKEALSGEGAALAAAGRWVFALTVYLALAAVVFSRRELPYGND
jgi:ABC-type transport system involved in multi-copper enzyme maturation permease subunit